MYAILRVVWAYRRTEDGVRGLEPLPLAYDLRNKRVRMRQKCVVFTKKYEKFSGEAPSPDPSPVGIPMPHPLGACGTSTVDPSHSKILGTPVYLVTYNKPRRDERGFKIAKLTQLCLALPPGISVKL